MNELATVAIMAAILDANNGRPVRDNVKRAYELVDAANEVCTEREKKKAQAKKR